MLYTQQPDLPQEADLLPKRRRGRQSGAAAVEYEAKVAHFCSLILQIKSTMDFDVGSRGWCYILERHGLRKGQFDAAEKLIADCRKSGALPLGICAEDESRRAIGLQQLDDSDIECEATSWIDYITNDAHKNYTPISFWDGQKYYVEMATEKLDLRNLFEPPCADFYVPIQNFKGWSDLNARAAMMRRFAEHEAAGEILAEIQQVTNNFTAPAGACNSFQLLYKKLHDLDADLHQHIHLENNNLFPKALALEKETRQ